MAVKYPFNFTQAAMSGRPFRRAGSRDPWLVVGTGGVFHVMGEPAKVATIIQRDLQDSYEVLTSMATVDSDAILRALENVWDDGDDPLTISAKLSEVFGLQYPLGYKSSPAGMRLSAYASDTVDRACGSPRSPGWRDVRRAFVEKNPTCALCGGDDVLEVHHKQPFHLFPALELAEENLITLCESKRGGINCHLAFGHLGSFMAYNPCVVEDCWNWRQKVLKRPSTRDR